MAETVIDPARRVMYVTMGTSLFHSATWEATEELCKLVPGYEEWTTPDTLASPDLRLVSPRSGSIREGLRSALSTRNVEKWAAWLPEDFRLGRPAPTFLRYSAELTTILKFSEAPPNAGVPDLLGKYEQIRIVHDVMTSDGEKNLPYIAAVHLACYLNLLAAKKDLAVCVPLLGLSSKDPHEALEGLGRLADDIEASRERFRCFDFIASGGYKFYGPFLADLRSIPGLSMRLVYLHEAGRGIFISPRESLEPVKRRGKTIPLNMDYYDA